MATGKGNDQVRFELGYYACNPDIKVIAPWREWDLQSREKLIAYAEQNQIPVPKDKRGEAPFSVDANLLHTSSEGKVLEDPAGSSSTLPSLDVCNKLASTENGASPRLSFGTGIWFCSA